MRDFSELVEEKISSKDIYKGNVVHMFQDEVRLPNGMTATRDVLRHIGAVGIIPITEDGRVIIERQFRYPVNQVITEIPAGKLNTADEDRLEAAKRELKEETGIQAKEWIYLGEYHPAVAFTDEVISLYLAKGLCIGEQDLDEDEFLFVDKIPLEELVQDVMDGKITDGKTQIAVLKAARIMGL